MVETTSDSILYSLDDLERSGACNRGIKLSMIVTKLKDTVDVRPLLGRLQRLGLLRIIYNPEVDDEPLVQITESGRQQAIELLQALQHTR